MKTGYILFYHGKSFLSKSIEFFMLIFGMKKRISTKWIPSHMGTIFIEDSDIRIGESVWPRYKINDFKSNYNTNYLILKPKIDFTEEEIEKGRKYMLDLSTKGIYQWWKYPAWIYYSLTGKTSLFGKKSSDYNTICFESACRVLNEMRKGYFPEDYNFEAAYYGDVLYNNNFEIFIDKR